jgi:hypothetical protein
VSVDIENKSVVYLRAESGRFSVCQLSRSNNPLHLYAEPSHLLPVSNHHVEPQHGKNTPYRFDRLHCRHHCYRCMVWRRTEGATGTKRSRKEHVFQVLRNILIRRQVKQATLEASDAEKLKQMEMLRGQLVRQRDELQTKIDQLINGTGPASMPPRGR